MKIVGRVLIRLMIVALVLLGAGLGALFIHYPLNVAAADTRVESTPARLQRGEYLSRHVALCVDCHSVRDWKQYAGPIDDATLGQGGEAFDEKNGFPGAIYARNITPAGVGPWSDGELIRAITSGLSRDGHPLFPIMPYTAYRTMSQEDLYSIVAYIRSLKPIQNTVPTSHLNFPLNIIVRTIPAPSALVPSTPLPTDKVAYGQYITTMAGCVECHTPVKNGQPLPGMAFAGGRDFQFPDGTHVRSANITPDPTGLAALDEAHFVSGFKTMDHSHPLKAGGHQTIMPWTSYSGMTPTDLEAIYAYLRTVKPVANKVE